MEEEREGARETESAKTNKARTSATMKTVLDGGITRVGEDKHAQPKLRVVQNHHIFDVTRWCIVSRDLYYSYAQQKHSAMQR